MFCRNCGKRNEINARFCEFCGKAMDYSRGNKNVPKQQMKHSNGYTHENTSSSKKVGLIFVSFLMLAVLLVIVVSYLMMKQNVSKGFDSKIVEEIEATATTENKTPLPFTVNDVKECFISEKVDKYEVENGYVVYEEQGKQIERPCDVAMFLGFWENEGFHGGFEVTRGVGQSLEIVETSSSEGYEHKMYRIDPYGEAKDGEIVEATLSSIIYVEHNNQIFYFWETEYGDNYKFVFIYNTDDGECSLQEPGKKWIGYVGDRHRRGSYFKTKELEELQNHEEEINKEEATTTLIDGIDLDEIVVLGQYKGLALEKEKYEISEEDIHQAMEFEAKAVTDEVKGEVVKQGDKVNIDYKGIMNGQEMEGATDKGYDLWIGSGTFIEGFEEGLVGAQVGETRELNLKYPENYSEGLRGKDATFIVTINKISRASKEITDDWVKANTEYSTVSEYKAAIYQRMKNEYDREIEDELMIEAWKMVLVDTEVKEIPNNIMEYAREVQRESAEQYLSLWGRSMEEHVLDQGMTMQEYGDDAEENAEYASKQMLVCYAIIQKEGVKETDILYQRKLEEVEENYGMAREELVAEYGEESIRQKVFFECVYQILIDNAQIVEVTM